MYLKDYSVSPLLTQLITDNGGYKVTLINVIFLCSCVVILYSASALCT